MTIIIDDNWNPCRNRRATDTGDDCVPVSAFRTNANDIVIVRTANVANKDIVTTREHV